jgi:serpin B
MHATVDGARTVATQDLTVLELPYRGDNLALDILMPTIASGGVAALDVALTPSALSADLALMDTASIDLYLPKFSFSTRLSLIPILSGLGITDAFEHGVADFSGIDGAKDLNLQVVVQQAFVEVDEQGTVAAAATAAGGGITSVVREPTTVRIDHPFLFLIRDLRTNVILFMGQVVDPRGK